MTKTSRSAVFPPAADTVVGNLRRSDCEGSVLPNGVVATGKAEARATADRPPLGDKSLQAALVGASSRLRTAA